MSKKTKPLTESVDFKVLDDANDASVDRQVAQDRFTSIDRKKG